LANTTSPEKALLPAPSQTSSLETNGAVTSGVVTNPVTSQEEIGPVNSEVPEKAPTQLISQEATEATCPVNARAPEVTEKEVTDNPEGPVAFKFLTISQSISADCPSPLQPEFDYHPVNEAASATVQGDSTTAVHPEPSNVTTQAPVSSRATRSQHVRPSKATEAEKKLWTYDAGMYLRESLAQFGGDKLVGLFRDFEKALGNPIGKVRVHFDLCEYFNCLHRLKGTKWIYQQHHHFSRNGPASATVTSGRRQPISVPGTSIPLSIGTTPSSPPTAGRPIAQSPRIQRLVSGMT
jgi:hypothetical protein